MTVRGPNLCLEGSTFGPRKISAWREAVAPFWDVQIRREDTPDFRGQSEVYHLGNAILGVTAASGLRDERSRCLVARMGVDHVAAQVRMAGHATVHAAGRETAMAPGDVCLLDLSRPLALESSDYRAMTVILPRALFPGGGDRLDGAHGTIVRGATPFGTLVNDHLHSLGANAPRFAPEEARAAAEATAILLSAAARTTSGTSTIAPPTERSPVFLAVRRYINAEIGLAGRGADLDVEHICRRFGVSRSGLYRLFAPLGGVAEHIRRRRLARAYRELADCTPRVSEVAYRCGYDNPASFTQAFRAEFGVSPAEVRAGARAEGEANERRSPSDLPADDGWDAFYDWVLRLDA